MIKRLATLAAALSIASTIFAAPALAGSSSKNLSITATTASNCTAISPGTITFGSSYDPNTYPTGTPLQDTTPATFSTNCTLGDAINWTVGVGSNCGKGSVAADRALVDGSTHYLSYELYQNSGFTTAWAYAPSCGAPTAVSQTGGGANSANSISVYAEIPGGQDAFVGSSNTDTYTDTVAVTLNY